MRTPTYRIIFRFFLEASTKRHRGRDRDPCGVSRRSRIRVLALSCVFLYAQLAGAQTLPQRPNILLLMAEDMSARVGAFGDPVAVTPHLDALAAQGVRYTNTFTTAGVCAPSRAAHILGMHQISTGTQHMRSSTRPEGSYYSVPPDSGYDYS